MRCTPTELKSQMNTEMLQANGNISYLWLTVDPQPQHHATALQCRLHGSGWHISQYEDKPEYKKHADRDDYRHQPERSCLFDSFHIQMSPLQVCTFLLNPACRLSEIVNRLRILHLRDFHIRSYFTVMRPLFVPNLI